MSRGQAPFSSQRVGDGGGRAIRGLLFYLILLPGLVMLVLGLLRFRFAVRFWRRMYIVGLVYVAVLLVRLIVVVVW